jgi:FAD/FMN-containing dehydrogenase
VHLNVLPPPGLDPEARAGALATAKRILDDHVDRWQGSISAEHGIGRMKRADWEARLDPVERGLLDGLKRMLDPAGRMNPGCQRS